MAEKPILFSSPMVRALLAGKKTQTRRPVSVATWRAAGRADHAQEVSCVDGQWQYADNDGWHDFRAPLPRWQIGDRLWVRENGWQRPERTPKMMREGADTWEPYYFDADGLSEADHAQFKEWGFKRRPSIHMPRKACRLVLEVIDVRVEQLQEISEADAIAEGVRRIGEEYENFPNDGPNKYTVDLGVMSFNQPTAAGCFRGLWEAINGKGTWYANPWVWVVAFRSASSHHRA